MRHYCDAAPHSGKNAFCSLSPLLGKGRDRAIKLQNEYRHWINSSSRRYSQGYLATRLKVASKANSWPNPRRTSAERSVSEEERSACFRSGLPARHPRHPRSAANPAGSVLPQVPHAKIPRVIFFPKLLSSLYLHAYTHLYTHTQNYLISKLNREDLYLAGALHRGRLKMFFGCVETPPATEGNRSRRDGVQRT